MHPAAAAGQAQSEEDAAGQEAEDDGAGGAAARVRGRFGGGFCRCVEGRCRIGSGGSLWEVTAGGGFSGRSPGGAHAGWRCVSRRGGAAPALEAFEGFQRRFARACGGNAGGRGAWCEAARLFRQGTELFLGLRAGLRLRLSRRGRDREEVAGEREGGAGGDPDRRGFLPRRLEEVAVVRLQVTQVGEGALAGAEVSGILAGGQQSLRSPGGCL